jgi:hypothetical protein
LTDILGRTLYETALSDGGTQLSFGEHLPDGSYIVQVYTENGLYTEKLIKN